MIVQIVRYGSELSQDEVMKRFEDRADGYRSVPGLLQKYYVHYPESGQFGGVYVWESREALQSWRDGQLAETLAATYRVTDGPTSEDAEVMLVLHGERDPL